MRSTFLLVFLCFFAANATCQAQTIFLVRHAERADAGGVAQKDPDLSEAGRARARALATTLRDAKISAIYVTEFKRTQQTAQPLAERIGITPIVIDAKQTSELVAKLRSNKSRVLVIGHSNTVPEILKRLGIASPPAIGENDYNDLFVFERGSSADVVRLHYR